jgi:hypothetical protein
MVCAIEPPSNSIRNALERRVIRRTLLWSGFQNRGRTELKDGAKSNTVLSQETWFMSHLEEVHHNFESAYQYLTRFRRNLMWELLEILVIRYQNRVNVFL